MATSGAEERAGSTGKGEGESEGEKEDTDSRIAKLLAWAHARHLWIHDGIAIRRTQEGDEDESTGFGVFVRPGHTIEERQVCECDCI